MSDDNDFGNCIVCEEPVRWGDKHPDCPKPEAPTNPDEDTLENQLHYHDNMQAKPLDVDTNSATGWMIKYQRLQCELVTARKKLSIAQVGSGHYRTELDTHIQESQNYVTESVEKILALSRELAARNAELELFKRARDKREAECTKYGSELFLEKLKSAALVVALEEIKAGRFTEVFEAQEIASKALEIK